MNKKINKRTTHGKPKKSEEDIKKLMFIIAFDLFTRQVEFGNGSNQVTMIAYKIQYYPNNGSLLKIILSYAHILDITKSSFYFTS